MNTNIKQAREASKKTQQECADIVGVSLRAWQTYEQGIREPKYEILCAIANLFGVSTDYLLGRPDAKPPENPLQLLAEQKNFDELEEAIFERYIQLPEDTRKEVIKFMYQAAEEAAKKRRAKATSSTSENPDKQSTETNGQQYMTAARSSDNTPPHMVKYTNEQMDYMLNAPELPDDL